MAILYDINGNTTVIPSSGMNASVLIPFMLLEAYLDETQMQVKESYNFTWEY